MEEACAVYICGHDICIQCKTAAELGLTTRGTAEQCADCYKQTDVVVSAALSGFTHLGYFHP